MQHVCMLYASHGYVIYAAPTEDNKQPCPLLLTAAAWHKIRMEEEFLVRICTNGMPQRDAGYLLVHGPWLRQAQTLPFCALSYLFILLVLLRKACFGSS
jgi:hypothetical protein